MTEPITTAVPSAARAHNQLKVTSPTLRTGLYTGALLVIVMTGALIAANRLPWLDNRALERNAASYGLFVIFMLVPILRFLNRPAKMFASAMIGWSIFVIAYDIAGYFFHSLFQAVRTPFVLMVEGMIVYGVCAVGSWVGEMALHARKHPITPRRRRSDFYPPQHHQ
ncbi:MAG: hypothetical protein WCA91_20115 [Candidatus Acidiferrales bacterium]|jgi:hypothetical protein